MIRNITPLSLARPQQINKSSRLYFHVAVKANRAITLQEKRFASTTMGTSEANIVKELLEGLLKDTKVTVL